MPIEIRQLVIKSKTINDENKNGYSDSDNPDVDADRTQSERVTTYQRTGSPDETRER